MSCYVNESSDKSSINNNYKPKGRMSLDLFNKTKLTMELANKNDIYYNGPTFKDLRDLKGYVYTDKENSSITVAIIAVATYKDKKSWIQPMEVNKKYRGYGLSNQLLDIAINELGAKYLAVHPDNELAISIYKKRGFKIYEKNKYNMYLMTIDPKQKIKYRLNECINFEDIIIK